MKIKVNEQPQRFYLALKEWTPVVGHAIQVGDYQFCAIPVKGGEAINISEVTTGTRLHEFHLNDFELVLTSSKESSIRFFDEIGKRLKRVIKSQEKFDEILEHAQMIVHERLGDMPEIEDVEEELE